MVLLLSKKINKMPGLLSNIILLRNVQNKLRNFKKQTENVLSFLVLTGKHKITEALVLPVCSVNHSVALGCQ